MSIQYERLVTDSVATQIAHSIRDAILEGRLKVDERLPTEEQLAARFKVSRPTVREALKRLAAENLIRSRRGPTGGTFVNRPTQKELAAHLMTATTLLVSLGEFDLAQVAEARGALEMLCVRLAATRRTQEHLDTLERELKRQETRSLPGTQFCASDVRFHRAIVDATGNEVLKMTMVSVIESLQPIANSLLSQVRNRKIIVEQHRDIYGAIKAKNVQAAERALNTQMQYLATLYPKAEKWFSTAETRAVM